MATALFFLHHSSEEGIFCSFFLVSMGMNRFIRCVCTWQGGGDLNGNTSLLLWNYFYFYFYSQHLLLPFFLHGEMDTGIWSSATYTKAYEKLAFFFLFSCLLVSFGTTGYTYR
ncbi:hypothetical protein ACQKWADRAFT_232484 [Trichoderma austrokoningii]